MRGHAWAGDDRKVDSVHLSIDFGATWIDTKLDEPVNAYAWQNWRAEDRVSQSGILRDLGKGDGFARRQPTVCHCTWNPKGYLNNSMHRIAVIVS